MKTNEVLENIKARRSVRAYTDRQVSEEDLQAILEAATFAPSGMHLETWHFTAIQNADKLAELNERIKGAFAKSDEPKLQERGHSKTYCCYYHAPTLVIVSNEPTQWWAGAYPKATQPYTLWSFGTPSEVINSRTSGSSQVVPN